MKPKSLTLILILVCVLLVSPASAEIVPNPGIISGYQEITISGSALEVDLTQIGSDKAISNIYVHGVSPGATVNFAILGSGGSYSGSYSYQGDGINSNISLTLGNAAVSWEELSLIKMGASFCIRYATDSNTSSEGLVLSNVPPFDQDQDKYAYLAIPHISSCPVTGIQLYTSTGDEVELTVRYNDAADVVKYIDTYSDAVTYDYLGQLIDFVVYAMGALTTLILIFKFIFLDHFGAVVILYESVLIGYAASQSNGLIPFVRKFVRYNESFFTIVQKFITFVLDFFYKLIQAIKPL